MGEGGGIKSVKTDLTVGFKLCSVSNNRVHATKIKKGVKLAGANAFALLRGVIEPLVCLQ